MRGAIAILALGTTAFAQDPTLQFEVASVRPSDPANRTTRAPRGGPGTADPEHLNYQNAFFQELLMDAYGVQRDQLEGPDWAVMDDRSGAHYDLSAKIPPGATKQQVAIMLQNLLKDRFKLQLHHATIDRSGLALVVAKGGSKLKASAGPPSAPERNQTDKGAVRLQQQKDGFPELFPQRNMGGTLVDGVVRMRFRDYPLSDCVGSA
jgi:uncharacterized protein (TIGR03435 family)